VRVGDTVKLIGQPKDGRFKVVRFYANHGTVLVEQEKTSQLAYFDYARLEKDEGR